METPSTETPPATPTVPLAAAPQAKQKRKREAKLKPLIETTAAAAETLANETLQPTPTPASLGTLTEKPKTSRRPRKKKFKATKFDKALAKLVVKGERSASKIKATLRVDDEEFGAALNRLCEAGLVARGKYDADYLSFTVKGFDEFASLFRKTLDAETPEDAGNVVLDARQTLLKTEFEQKEKEKEEEKARQQQDALHQALAEEEKKLLSASFTAGEELDLNDAFKKGAPNGNQNEAKTKEQKRQATPKKEAVQQLEVDAVSTSAAELRKTIEKEVAAKGAALKIGETEVCELCKAPFKIALKGGHPKYGHCFCGAAYHKDCYETLAQAEGKDEGRCVRCGKKVKLAMDARSEEAVKELKNVF